MRKLKEGEIKELTLRSHSKATEVLKRGKYFGKSFQLGLTFSRERVLVVSGVSLTGGLTEAEYLCCTGF